MKYRIKVISVFKMATKMASREGLEESNGKRTQASSSVNTESSDTDESSSEVEVKRKKKKKKRMKQKKRGKENKAEQNWNVKWSNEKIFRLIKLYEERPCLWDVFSQQYHNRETTSKAKSELEVSLFFVH